MLTKMTRSIIPMVSLALLVSCGKKISDPKTEEIVKSPEYQLPAATLVVSLTSKLSQFFLVKSGHFNMPEALKVKSSNGLGKVVNIYYNYYGYADDYQFKCIYTGKSQDSLDLKKCVSKDGGDYGDLDILLETPVILDSNTTIRMETTTSDLKVDAYFGVTWI